MLEYSDSVRTIVPPHLDLAGRVLTAAVRHDGTGLMRTTAMVSDHIAVVGRGGLSYLLKGDRQHITGEYPFVASMAGGWEVINVEFPDPPHSISVLRPASTFERRWSVGSPAITLP